MNKVFITAEIGINHSGNLDTAKQLINMAIRCGCDAVKFQKRTIEDCYTKEFLDSPRESPWGTTQREQKLGLEFGQAEYDEIDAYCKKNGIIWYASAWDIKSQLFLRQYDLPYNKIASKMMANEELLTLVAKEGKPTFISTGLNDWSKIYRAIEIFNNCPFTLMHCVMKYPCSVEECNLDRINVLKGVCSPVGYSSHYSGILDTTLAVLLGAVALEKHITLDRASYGTDQSASVEERGLHLMVRDAHNVGKML